MEPPQESSSLLSNRRENVTRPIYGTTNATRNSPNTKAPLQHEEHSVLALGALPLSPINDMTGTLHRGLSSRQVQMIAIAGTIGTGLFLGTGRSLAEGGPASMLICYAIVGSIVYVTLLLLGEMATQYPVAGECIRSIPLRSLPRCIGGIIYSSRLLSRRQWHGLVHLFLDALYPYTLLGTRKYSTSAYHSICVRWVLCPISWTYKRS
jgi:Amino acid permease